MRPFAPGTIIGPIFAFSEHKKGSAETEPDDFGSGGSSFEPTRIQNQEVKTLARNKT